MATYDPIAGMYDVLWADWYIPAALPALQKLFFSRVAPTAAILDVCCGSGHVTSEFVRRGYKVTGVDASAELVSLARQRVPEARFVVQDVTQLELEHRFDAAISTFDSLNHILTMYGLEVAFLNIRKALRRGALFVFDMNLEEAYFADSRQWHATVRDWEVSLVRGDYDLASKIACTELIWFLKTEDEKLWERRSAVVKERCYSQAEINRALIAAGFTDIRAELARDAGVTAELGFGRLFFSARA